MGLSVWLQWIGQNRDLTLPAGAGALLLVALLFRWRAQN